MPDFMPRTDAEFQPWQMNFMQVVNNRNDEFGITDAEFTALDAAKGRWENALAGHALAQTAAAAATLEKNQAREEFVRLIRQLVARLQTHPNMKDADRIAFGIPVRSTERTQAPAPTTRPVLQVDTSQRLRHTIAFTDETTPSRRAKPDGVKGCEIYFKVGDAPPADAGETHFLALDSASPYLAEYTGADAGKIAHYMARWVNSSNEKGPWSQIVSATITA